ncbi:tyrosine-type recombinase/integrase [Sorangium sp. So ce388]|uniref:tyrosine-type recombinase/integrase n=1 Tax=Sorangium sp. So ce388 TaxID=3133309 RepID=UPI003F5BA85F
MHETVLQRAVREAGLANGLSRRASCHTLRHSLAMHLLEAGCDIRMNVLNRGGLDVRSPLDDPFGSRL